MSRAAGARRSGPGPLVRLASWLAHHGHSLFSTLGRLSRTPLATGMTLGVIGIALALPTGLHLLVDNTRKLSGEWGSALQLSVFMEPGVGEQRARELATELAARDEFSGAALVTPAEALEEFRTLSGFGPALDALQENPLPAVIVLTPAPGINAAGQLTGAVGEVERLPGVDFVQLDTQWLQRLYALLALFERAIMVVGVLLGIAVVVTVGNTIRLDIQHRRQEIEVIKLIGGSDAFIRRPFLYTGFWYGFGGGLAATILVGIAWLALGGPVAQLSGLYGSSFALSGLGFKGVLTLLAAGAMLGWAGSWVAVGRHLREIEPA
jgi:cell division transport system permease protein